jgi:hypothetical protein
MRRSPLAAFALPVLLLAASGCCGGYSVVRTTFVSRPAGSAAAAAEAPGLGEEGEAPELPAAPAGSSGAAYVLHYSRLGEPPSSCDSGLQYLEDLFIRVPSLRPGETHTIGQGGVIAMYSRSQEGPRSGAKQVLGTVRIVEREGDDVTAALEVTIVLPSGESVELDDEYTFHPGRSQ